MVGAHEVQLQLLEQERIPVPPPLGVQHCEAPGVQPDFTQRHEQPVSGLHRGALQSPQSGSFVQLELQVPGVQGPHWQFAPQVRVGIWVAHSPQA
ncbi:MAG: hypothetical protein IT371_00385 [Deltaproteobacteria bacterium]|nr:hypothetical protein [Deltaproteobacteria bacterium]